jgi:hypothetical protein
MAQPWALWHFFDPVPILGMTTQEKESWIRLAQEAVKLEAQKRQGLEQILQGGGKELPLASSDSTTKSL